MSPIFSITTYMIAPLMANNSRQLVITGRLLKSPYFMISPKHFSKVRFIPEKVAVDHDRRTIGTLIYLLRDTDF